MNAWVQIGKCGQVPNSWELFAGGQKLAVPGYKNRQLLFGSATTRYVPMEGESVCAAAPFWEQWEFYYGGRGNGRPAQHERNSRVLVSADENQVGHTLVLDWTLDLERRQDSQGSHSSTRQMGMKSGNLAGKPVCKQQVAQLGRDWLLMHKNFRVTERGAPSQPGNGLARIIVFTAWED